MLSFVLVALVAIATANPVPAATSSPALCPVVTKLVTALKQQNPASAFCSSYLQIPVVTVTNTQTQTSTATVTSSLTGTITVTNPWAASVSIIVTPMSTLYTEAATIETITHQDTVTVTSALTCTPPVAPNNKRAAAVTKPGCLSAFTVSTAISSACKCLSVPTSTTTATAQATSHVTVTAVQGTLATVTYTPTNTITNFAPTVTITSTTSTQSSTITVTAVPSTVTAYTTASAFQFQIQAMGGSINGDFIRSPDDNTPYTFGRPGNVFSLADDSAIGGQSLIDQNLANLVVYDEKVDGQIAPLLQSAYQITCRLQFNSRGSAQQTCPLDCQPVNGGPQADWDCDGGWFRKDTGSCSSFQSYAVSQ